MKPIPSYTSEEFITKMKEKSAQDVNSAGTFAEPGIKTNVLYSAIPMPSNCNEILQ